jgi:hypothetical protein
MPDTGGRQRRQDRQRMHEALIEHAEDDVDDDQRRCDERRLARQRRHKSDEPDRCHQQRSRHRPLDKWL